MSKGRELLAVRLGEDQRRVVGRYDHAVRERNAIGHLPRGSVWSDEGKNPGRKLATREIETGIADVSVAAAVHRNVVPRMARKIN